MSVTISIAPTSDDIWIIRNAVYRWLVNRVADVHPDRTDVVEQLTISGYNGGISLEHYLEESRDLSLRFADSLLATIDHILTHAVPLTDDAGRPWPELQQQVYDSLGEWRDILHRDSRWRLNLNAGSDNMVFTLGLRHTFLCLVNAALALVQSLRSSNIVRFV